MELKSEQRNLSPFGFVVSEGELLLNLLTGVDQQMKLTFYTEVHEYIRVKLRDIVLGWSYVHTTIMCFRNIALAAL